MIINKLLFAII